MKIINLFLFIFIVAIFGIAGYVAYVRYLKPANPIIINQQNKTDAQDFSFDIVNKNIEIKDNISKDIIQRIPLSPEIYGDFPIENMASFKDDINFDGYKDLSIVTIMAATNVYSSFYIYNPESRDFAKDKILTDLGMPTFDAKAKTIKTYQTGGCAGADFEEDIYSFSNGKYALTTTREGACCPTSDGSAPAGVTVSELRNNKMEVVRTDACPAQ